MTKSRLIRYAILKGAGIKKRARKAETIRISATGDTDKECLEKIEALLLETLGQYRTFALDDYFISYNAEVLTFDDGREILIAHGTVNDLTNAKFQLRYHETKSLAPEVFGIPACVA